MWYAGQTNMLQILTKDVVNDNFFAAASNKNDMLNTSTDIFD